MFAGISHLISSKPAGIIFLRKFCAQNSGPEMGNVMGSVEPNQITL